MPEPPTEALRGPTPEEVQRRRCVGALIVGLRLLHGWDMRCVFCDAPIPPDSETFVPTDKRVCFECGVAKFAQGVGLHGDLLNGLVKMAMARLGPAPLRPQLQAESLAHMHAYVADKAAKKEPPG